MASEGDATFSTAAATSEAPRGAGGKLRRQTARRHSTTPYSRPPQNQEQRRPWISRIVDPAYRIITGGATRILPYFFSNTAVSAPALTSPEDGDQHQDKLQDDPQENDPSSITPSFNKPKLTSVEEGGTSSAAKVSESNFNISAQAKSNIALNDVVAISELEKLMEGKTFSRAETDRLIEIITSRAIDLPDVVRDERVEIPVREGAKKNIIFDKKKEPIGAKDASSELWATPTPFAKSITLDGGKQVHDEAGLSPAELAKAYMGGQTLSSSSQGFIARNEKNGLDGGMIVANSSGASPSSKPSACWPGVKLNEQLGFSTPQSQRENFGIQSFPRTPYPRSILSSSKSKLMQLQDNSSKRLSALQSPSQSVQTRYGQLKLSKGSDSGVFGPNRRSRQSATMSPYSRPSRGRFENSANMKNSEAGESSNLYMPQKASYGKHIGLEVGTPTVPRHSSQIARTILDHLERTQPTPKDKSAELKLATSWRYPQSSKTVEQARSNINSVKKDGSAKLNEDIPNIISHIPPSSVAKATTDDAQNAMTKTAAASNGIFSGSSSGTTLQHELEKPKDSLFGSTHEKDGAKAVSSFGGEPANLPKPPSHSQGNNNNKRLLSSITVAKPNQRWAFPSGSNASFTFPVSSSDGATSSEPPTPSIMPFTTSTAPSSGVDIQSHHHEATKDDEIPQFSFGGNRREDKLPLVFDFPSVSEEVMNEDDEKLSFRYTFGSKKAERISFSSAGSDGVCC